MRREELQQENPEKNYFSSEECWIKILKASGRKSAAEINWKMQFKLIEKLKQIANFNAVKIDELG